MTRPAGWTVSVTAALRPHFKQPGGASRAGADWAVTLAGDAGQKKVLVRAYADDVGALPPEDEARLVMAFVGQLIESGWTPEQYRGTPGELVVPRQPGVSPAQSPEPLAAKRPWWRVW